MMKHCTLYKFVFLTIIVIHSVNIREIFANVFTTFGLKISHKVDSGICLGAVIIKTRVGDESTLVIYCLAQPTQVCGLEAGEGASCQTGCEGSRSLTTSSKRGLFSTTVTTLPPHVERPLTGGQG